MAELKVAVVGAVRGAGHLAAFGALPECRVTAVCDLDPVALESAGARAGVPANGQFLRYDDLLERGRPDIVVLATPMHVHVPQSVQALERGIHVLSEVSAAVDLDECRQLAAAARASTASYMMAENFCFFRANLLVTALARAGLFGELYFAEGEYVADCKAGHHHPDGSPTWRATWHVGKRGCTYGTHSLGPALEFFGPDARVTTVSCHGSGVHTDPEHPHDDTCLMLCHTSTGGLIKVRQDLMSNRPYGGRYFSLQGTRGSYEAPRGLGDDHKIWLEGYGEDGERRAWRPLWDFLDEYLPAAGRDAPPDIRARGGSEDSFCTARAFARSILDGTPPPIGIDRALDYTVPCIISEHSIDQGGIPLPVPDLRAR